MIDSAQSSSLISAFKDGLRTAHGDRLVDILGLIAYNIESLKRHPVMLIRAAQELLPPLIDLATDDHTNVMLRGTVARLLALIGPALERALHDRVAAACLSPDAVESLRALVLDGIGCCLRKPTAVAGRTAIARVLGDLRPADQARALVEPLLDDPVAGVACLARHSLAALDLARAGSAALAPSNGITPVSSHRLCE